MIDVPNFRRNLRLPSLNWSWNTLSPHQAQSLVVALVAATVLVGGLFANIAVARAQIYPIDWYDLTFALVCLAPAAAAHLWFQWRGRASVWCWLLWLPGIGLYWLRPWVADGEVTVLWMRPSYIWHNMSALWWASWFNQPLPPRAFAAAVGFVLVTTATAAMVVRPFFAFKSSRNADRPTRAGAGTAEGLPQSRWATAREVAGSFHYPGGIVLGEHTDPLEHSPNFEPADPNSWQRQGKGKLITLDPNLGNGHVIVIAPSAGGKTAGLVIPNILHYDKGPIVVLDPKGDLYARTKDARKKMGYTSRLIDADNGFDPFKMISPLVPISPSLYFTLAKTLMPLPPGNNEISKYFHDMSCNLFAALVAYFIDQKSKNVAAAISTFLNQDRDTIIKHAKQWAETYKSALIGDEFRGLAGLDERTFPGVVKSITNVLAFVRFADAACYGSSEKTASEHLEALDPKTDIFINIPARLVQDFASFVRLLIGAMYIVTELLEQPDRPRARRLFLIDEARVLGGMDALTNVRDAGRSIGMHLMLIYQSLGQLKQAWGGEAGADSWIDSCEARVVSAVGAARTAQDIVTMLGRRTIQTRTRGKSSSAPTLSLAGGSVSSSASEQLRETPLMSPAALGRLPFHGSIIFTRRTPPILSTKALYFTRADMSAKVKTPEAVSDQIEATKRRKRAEELLKALKKKEAEEAENDAQRPPESDDDEAPDLESQAKREREDAAYKDKEWEQAEGQHPEGKIWLPESGLDTIAKPTRDDDEPVLQTAKEVLAAANPEVVLEPDAEDYLIGVRHFPERVEAPTAKDAADASALEPAAAEEERQAANRKQIQDAVKEAQRESEHAHQAPSQAEPTTAADESETKVAESSHLDQDLVQDVELDATPDPTPLAETPAAPTDGVPAAAVASTAVTGETAPTTVAPAEPQDTEARVPEAAATPPIADRPATASPPTASVVPSATKPRARAKKAAKKLPALDKERLRRELFERREELFTRAFEGPHHLQGSKEFRAGRNNGVVMYISSAEKCRWVEHTEGAQGDLFDLFAIAINGVPIQDAAAQPRFHAVLYDVCQYLGLQPEQYFKDAALPSRRQSVAPTAIPANDERDEDIRELITVLQDLAEPLAGSPAQTYLESRSITSWPDESVFWLPPLHTSLPDNLLKLIASANFGALTMFAFTGTDEVIGGQRVCIARNGNRIDGSKAKVNFGHVAGASLRLPAPTDNSDDAIIVTEGPETGLAVWHATRCEVWSIIGVTGFAKLQLPTDRKVILAPDNDQEGSAADKVFRKAVACLVANGIDIQIARAPEGPKQDLADTLVRAGTAAVRAVIAKAQPPTARDLPKTDG